MRNDYSSMHLLVMMTIAAVFLLNKLLNLLGPVYCNAIANI